MQKLNVEIVLKTFSKTNKKVITSLVESYFALNKIRPNTIITNFDKDRDSILADNVKAIIIDGIPNLIDGFINFESHEIKWYIYSLDIHGTVGQTDETDECEEQITSTHLVLPSEELFNLWENLHYESNIKENLLKYAQTIMEFSDKGIDPNIISCNRVILLHGPPGTGKTSLCKALAQKLTIRMQDRYRSGLLIEINSHSLFSKWFSESGKLVSKLFSKITEIVENVDVLVCLLIDEVESIAHARDQCVSGNEPSDSIRVVNAVLTQIDRIKKYSNVLILTTSNMTETIDLAFIDRADIKQFLGLPTIPAIYQIYYSCLLELKKAGIITAYGTIDSVENAFRGNNQNIFTNKLIKICEKSCGLSGRSLKKIPFISHALYLNQSPVDLNDFLNAMEKAIETEKLERSFFNNKTKN